MTEEEFKIEAKRITIKRFLSSAKIEDWQSVSAECDSMDFQDCNPVDFFDNHVKEHRMFAKVLVHLYDRIQQLEEQLAKK